MLPEILHSRDNRPSFSLFRVFLYSYFCPHSLGSEGVDGRPVEWNQVRVESDSFENRGHIPPISSLFDLLGDLLPCNGIYQYQHRLLWYNFPKNLLLACAPSLTL